MAGTPAASAFYEVRCDRCRVSGPPEMRRCVHCGGPTRPATAPAMYNDPELLDPMRWSPSASPNAADPSGSTAASDEEAVATQRSPLRKGVAVLWLLMALGTMVLRMCSGQ